MPENNCFQKVLLKISVAIRVGEKIQKRYYWPVELLDGQQEVASSVATRTSIFSFFVIILTMMDTRFTE